MSIPPVIFRITKNKWAGMLNGSGYAARWNPNGIFVCYAAQSKALACLEMLVHLQTNELSKAFKVTKINLPQDISIKEISENELIENWKDFFEMHLTQKIGKEWVFSNETCLLKVPSAILSGEFNYLINPAHPDFKRIVDLEVEDFLFDTRLAKTLNPL